MVTKDASNEEYNNQDDQVRWRKSTKSRTRLLRTWRTIKTRMMRMIRVVFIRFVKWCVCFLLLAEKSDWCSLGFMLPQ